MSQHIIIIPRRMFTCPSAYKGFLISTEARGGAAFCALLLPMTIPATMAARTKMVRVATEPISREVCWLSSSAMEAESWSRAALTPCNLPAAVHGPTCLHVCCFDSQRNPQEVVLTEILPGGHLAPQVTGTVTEHSFLDSTDLKFSSKYLFMHRDKKLKGSFNSFQY
jgi:hypothetical protein